tara:strand:- start:400 stop:1143 length:744 start_codon:yes stop_codon:yes gene_type:complete
MFEIFSIKLYWYGFMYALSFIIIDYLIITASKNKKITLPESKAEKFTIVILIFAIFGGRIGYILFYDFSYYLSNPERILYLWEGGMSFHGGLIGVVAGALYTAKKYELQFLETTDIICLYAPIGLFFGRVGNFINSELYGIKTSGEWGIIFPEVDSYPRHPSMLYEAFLEGIILFIALFIIKQKKVAVGIISGYFLLLYGIFRFFIEFVRVPDAHIGYIYYDWVTMGQLLTIPMLVVGVSLINRKSI